MKFLIVLAAVVALAYAQSDSTIINPEGCGRRPLQTRNKIVGGQEATKHDWGWQIALYRGSSFSCGGSLINSQWVITAAHCVAGGSASSFSVLIGAHNRLFPEEGSVRKSVIKVFYHESYNSARIKNDVALLKLDSPVEFTDKIVPVCIDEDGLDYEGALAAATGWGTLRAGGSLPPAKQEVNVDILPASACTSGYGTSYDHSLEVCAGVIGGGRDACQGDSGGPLVVQSVVDATWNLFGITSWGRGCALNGYPGIYARVSTFLPWFQEKIANN